MSGQDGLQEKKIKLPDASQEVLKESEQNSFLMAQAATYG